MDHVCVCMRALAHGARVYTSGSGDVNGAAMAKKKTSSLELGSKEFGDHKVRKIDVWAKACELPTPPRVVVNGRAAAAHDVWHDDVYESILVDLANGHNLLTLVGGTDQPSMRQLQNWLRADSKRGVEYGQAKTAYAEFAAFAMSRIATGEHRVERVTDEHGNTSLRIRDTTEAIRRDELVARMLGWQAERMNPDAYGARINQHRTDGPSQPSRLVIGQARPAAPAADDGSDGSDGATG